MAKKSKAKAASQDHDVDALTSQLGGVTLRSKPNATALAWDSYFGKGDLRDWQRLCQDLGLDGNLPSKTACRKAIKTVHVNIKQFLNAGKRPDDVAFFKHTKHLANWTSKHDAFYPKRGIPKGSPLRQLLRGLL